jgi:hypothetical protein
VYREIPNPGGAPLTVVNPDVIGAFRKAGAGGVPHLIELLKSPRREVRSAAAQALAELGPVASARAVGIAAVAADETNEGVQFLLLTALGRVGPAGTDHADVLRKALTSPRSAVRFAAAEALLALDPTDEQPIPVLAELVKPRDPEGTRPLPVVRTPDEASRPPRRGREGDRRPLHEAAAELLFEVDPEAAIRAGAFSATKPESKGGKVIRY